MKMILTLFRSRYCEKIPEALIYLFPYRNNYSFSLILKIYDLYLYSINNQLIRQKSK